MRPKTIVYFEWIMFGMILLNVLEVYLSWDATARLAAADHYSTFHIIIILIFMLVLIGTLTLLVSRRRSKIAMWILIALSALVLSSFLVSLVQSIHVFLGSDVLPLSMTALKFTGQVVAVGLLFTPSARRWMRREDEKERIAA